MSIWLTVLALAALLIGASRWLLARSGTRAKKKLIKRSIRNLYQRLEDLGLVQRTPGFIRGYHQLYPGLEMLEKNHTVIQEECLALLERKQDLTDIKELGGSYTQAGIHVIQWKSFMFKSGDFIEDNCRLAPRTAALLRDVPGLYTAFFSVLDPKQYITPHWGYYKGFVRYHLGVIVPNDNQDGSCWLRVNDDPDANAREDKNAIELGEKYYWRNGEGVVFDDTYLHDAANESDQVRVVLWLDLRKKLPWYLQAFNVLFLWMAHRDASVRKIRANAQIPERAQGHAV
jgi:beta-hydroxylase